MCQVENPSVTLKRGWRAGRGSMSRNPNYGCLLFVVIGTAVVLALVIG